MTIKRRLDWDGCYNARGLGGLRTSDGQTTRWGAVVRADAPDGLTPAGWSALEAHGIRTIIDLRNDDDRQGAAAPGVAGLATVHVPLDNRADTEFWEQWGHFDGTPLFLQPFLERMPDDQELAAVRARLLGPRSPGPGLGPKAR
jgi:hypothetical protein